MSDCLQDMSECVNAHKLCGECSESTIINPSYYEPKPFELWLLMVGERTILGTYLSEESVKAAKEVQGGEIRYMKEVDGG